MRIYDISRTISPELVVWPGDVRFSFEQPLCIKDGAPVNLTTLMLSAHTGTHADAPYHCFEQGQHPADLPLEKYIGPARVVTVPRRHGGIVPSDLGDLDLAGIQRLLIHSWVSEVSDNEWPQDFPYPTVELVDWLAEQGAVLLGVDMPSVDAFESEDLVCHRRLLQHGIVNLEMLRLANVPDGIYELIALPLKIGGICGSPVRAILRTL